MQQPPCGDAAYTAFQWLAPYFNNTVKFNASVTALRFSLASVQPFSYHLLASSKPVTISR